MESTQKCQAAATPVVAKHGRPRVYTEDEIGERKDAAK